MSPKPHGGGGHGRRRRPPEPRGPRREHVSELHPTEDPPDIATFAEWPLGPDIQRAIAVMDIVKPTPIQALTIGPVLEGRDVIAKAQTGTGKTLAFGAPMMSKIDAARATVLGLVMCPTRELAQQVHGVLATLGLPRGVRVAMCVGGDPQQPQIAQLQAGAQVVVGTPGRILDLYQQRFLSFPWTEFVVLDEADKMFEIGFIDDIKKILSFTPEERQTLLFSATFPTEVLKLAREATRNPLEVATAVGTVTVDTVEQSFMQIDEDDRPMALVRLLEQSGEKDVYLVFCARRTDVDRLMRSLERANLSIKALHGGYDQAARFRVMSAFRTGEVKALIATDVASRGLDVQHVSHVVNFSVPRDAEDYAHRIGRTGRAGRSGKAVTFVTPHDGRRWREILQRLKIDPTELELPRRSGQRSARGGSERPAREERERAPAAEQPSERQARRERSARGERPQREQSSERPTRARAERPARAESSEPEATEREPAERAASAERERPQRSERGSSRERAGAGSAPEGAREHRAPRSGGREREAARPASESTSPRRGARSDQPPERTRAERPARQSEERGGERPARQSGERAAERPARQSGERTRERPAPQGGERSAERPARQSVERGGERPARQSGERPARSSSERAVPIQDRSPEPRPRRRRRTPGAHKPEVDHRDPDGLGRWGNRAEDFD